MIFEFELKIAFLLSLNNRQIAMSPPESPQDTQPHIHKYHTKISC